MLMELSPHNKTRLSKVCKSSILKITLNKSFRGILYFTQKSNDKPFSFLIYLYDLLCRCGQHVACCDKLSQPMQPTKIYTGCWEISIIINPHSSAEVN